MLVAGSRSLGDREDILKETPRGSVRVPPGVFPGGIPKYIRWFPVGTVGVPSGVPLVPESLPGYPGRPHRGHRDQRREGHGSRP